MPETTNPTFTRQMHEATVARHAVDAVKALDSLLADMGSMSLLAEGVDPDEVYSAYQGIVTARTAAAKVADLFNRGGAA